MNAASGEVLQKYNVLLIEDDPLATDMARLAVAECCQEIGLTVVGCGAATLEWLSDSVAKKELMPHIILLDLKFPKLEGLAVLRKLRIHAATRDIPVVAFSTEYTQADVQMGYRVGVNSFIAKPTDQQQFADIFREQLAYWLQPRQRQLPLDAP